MEAGDGVGDEIEQWVQSVSSCSSQYGGERSISYTAGNVIGECSVFPAYGDFTSAFVLRQYGDWWSKLDKTLKKFRNNGFLSEDYIELVYEKEVQPRLMQVFETYNGGALVRVLGTDNVCVGSRKWEVLYKVEQCEFKSVSYTQKAIVKNILIKHQIRPISVLRLEFNQSNLMYHTEIDAVQLTGKWVVPTSPKTSYPAVPTTSELVEPTHRLIKPKVRAAPSLTDCCYSSTNQDDTFDSIDTLTRIVDDMRLYRECRREIKNTDAESHGFDKLSNEILQTIISLLDLKSCCQLSRVSKSFYKQCYDPLQYKSINLQPFWQLVNNRCLRNLITRCNYLQHLKLAWCEHISSDTFNSFLGKRGKNLLTLDLSCCPFADSTTINSIAKNCLNLSDLSLSANKNIASFTKLGLLCRLRRLNLYRTNINSLEIHTIIGSNENLEYLNIGSCVNISTCDSVCNALGKHCSKLEELNAWRSTSLSCYGIQFLVDSCSNIKCLDLGWCSDLKNKDDILLGCLVKCKNIIKLILTAIRTINDEILIAISKSCRFLQQLDIVGNSRITDYSLNILLCNCPDMELLDVSFCQNINSSLVYRWTKMYPKISIKF